MLIFQRKNKKEMITKLSNFFYRHSSGRNILFFLALQILFAAVVLPKLQPLIDIQNKGILDIKMKPFTPDEAYNVIGSYGEDGRKIYLFAEGFIDIIYPICYGLFFTLFASFLFKRVFSEGSFWRKLNILLIFASIFDIFEDIGFVAITYSYPTHVDGWASWANIFSLMKWGFMPISLALILVGLIGFGVKVLKRN
jgi:hypothetical protein